MAFGSYAPLYIDKLRELGNDKIGFRLTWELGAHADPLGMSFAGHSRLASLCHCARETIHAKLIELSEMDYIRCHITESYTRARAEITYQLSPYVLFIRDELLEDAMKLWDDGKPYTEIHDVINYQQPAFNQRKPASNQFENQRPNQTERPLNGKSQKPKNRPNAKKDGVNKHAKGGQQALAPMQSTGYSASETYGVAVADITPPRSAPPPPLNKPLDDPRAEIVAQMLRGFGGGTNIQNARQYVWEYGADNVRQAMSKARSKAVDNPVGYVINTLKAQASENPPISDEQKAQLEAELELSRKWRERNIDDTEPSF